MIGKPKFKKDDTVVFRFQGRVEQGIIYTVDPYGVWEDNSDVYYDIMIFKDEYKSEVNKKGECLIKHIKEQLVDKI